MPPVLSSASQSEVTQAKKWSKTVTGLPVKEGKTLKEVTREEVAKVRIEDFDRGLGNWDRGADGFEPGRSVTGCGCSTTKRAICGSSSMASSMWVSLFNTESPLTAHAEVDLSHHLHIGVSRTLPFSPAPSARPDLIDRFVSAIRSLSDFVDMHPGGAHVLLDESVAGKDATEAFFGLHRSEVLIKYSRYATALLTDSRSKIIYPLPGTLSPVPFAEPIYLHQEYHSPSVYYGPSHIALQKAARKFFDERVKPEALAREEDGERPDKALIEEMGRLGINHMRLGPGKHLHGMTLLGGVKGEEYNYFHELIISQEIGRLGTRGFMDGLNAGMWIGLTPIMNFGTEEMKAKIFPEVLSGKKYICLAISEAFAGSDVAGMRTTAKKTPDGKHYIVNGTKKWITNGHFSDYFSTGVQTGPGKLSMMLIPRSLQGVETKPIKTSYSSSAGTAYVTFDNVKVPAENLLGEEGKGLSVILSNFNHERWNMVCITSRWTRLITEECFKWAHQRKVFGKPLISQPVIRQKFAKMFALNEAVQSFLEQITFQMCNMTYAEQSDLLAGQIGLLKWYATRVAHDVADDAVQIFGGRGITKGAMGRYIEAFQRGYKFDAVLGGSEEILADLGVRQAMRKMPKAVL